MTYRAICLLSLQLTFLGLVAVTRAQDDEISEDGPWISCAIWLSDTEIAGTSSQGLLRRPATVVTASVDNLSEFETLGEAEVSLWSLTQIEDGDVVATDYTGGVHLFSGGEPDSFKAETSKWIRALSQTPDSDKLLVGDEDGKLTELTISGQEQTRQIEAHQAAIFDIAFSPAGDKLATACGDGSIKIFSWPDLEEQATLSRGPDSVWAVLFTPDGKQLISGGGTDNRRIQLWDVAAANSICTITRTRDWITDLVALPDSTLIVASCMNGRLVVADTDSRRQVAEVDAAESAIWSIDLSPDGNRLLLGTRKNGFAVVDIPDWQAEAEAIAQEAANTRPPRPTAE